MSDDLLPYTPAEPERGTVIVGRFPAAGKNSDIVLSATDPFNHAHRYLDQEWIELRKKCKVPEPAPQAVADYAWLCHRGEHLYGKELARQAADLHLAGVKVFDTATAPPLERA